MNDVLAYKSCFVIIEESNNQLSIYISHLNLLFEHYAARMYVHTHALCIGVSHRDVTMIHIQFYKLFHFVIYIVLSATQ